MGPSFSKGKDWTAREETSQSKQNLVSKYNKQKKQRNYKQTDYQKYRNICRFKVHNISKTFYEIRCQFFYNWFSPYIFLMIELVDRY